MDIKLSLIEANSPHSSEVYANYSRAKDFVDFKDIEVTPEGSAYKPFFATDSEMLNFNVILDQTSLYRFYQLEKAAEGVSQYRLALHSDRVNALDNLFISEFYQRYFGHVVGELKTQINSRYNWVNTMHTNTINKIEQALDYDFREMKEQCLEEVEELETKLSRSSTSSTHEDSRSERKMLLKLKVCLKRNLGNRSLGHLGRLADEIRSNPKTSKNLTGVFNLYRHKLEDVKRGFFKCAKRFQLRDPSPKSFNNDMNLFLAKTEPKPIDAINNDLEVFFDSSGALVSTVKELLQRIKNNTKTLARFRHEYEREVEYLATQLMITMISENLEKIKKCQKKVQKAFNAQLGELKKLLKAKIQDTNALIRKRNRRIEAEDIENTVENPDPELQSLLEAKRKYEQKIQYEDYLYTNRVLLSFKNQFKSLKSTLSSIPALDDDLDSVLKTIVKEFQWEISNLNNFEGLEPRDELVYNYMFKQYETIRSMFLSFYDEQELQELYQSVCLAYGQLRYFTQIIDYYYALNSKARSLANNQDQGLRMESRLGSQVQYNLNQVDGLVSKLAQARTVDVLELGLESHELFYMINWVAPIKIDRCCSFEARVDFSRHASKTELYRSELFGHINKKLISRKNIRNSWLVSAAKRIDQEGQVLDLLQFLASPQFWSLNSDDKESLRFEVSRGFESSMAQFSDPDVMYVNPNMPSVSYYQKVVRHLATSVYKLWSKKLNYSRTLKELAK